MKTCSVCSGEFPATTEFFYKHRNSLHAKCKTCYNLYQAERQSTPEAKEKRQLRLASQREHINARQRAYYEANREHLRNYWNEYARNRPEQNRVRTHRRRARIIGNGGSYTQEEWLSLIEKYNSTCISCNATDIKLTPDHVIPLVNGGANFIGNIQPLCISCNSKKGSKTIDYR